MKKTLGLVFVLALVAAPAMGQKVNIDYAHEYDFDSINSFQYVDTQESNIKGNEIMAERVATLIRQELREGGLEEVSENPDLYVTYHFTSEDRKGYTTTNFGYGDYWGGWGGWGWGGYPGGGMSTSTTTEYSYTEGTLIIDAYDAAEKKMIWRGSGTVTVKDKPEKQVKQVQNILKKLGKRWDKILAGKGK
jgi:hypothetical protein